MEKLIIRGNTRLNGSTTVSGAKNSVLPIMAGSILCKGDSVIHNVPSLCDIDSMIELLTYLDVDVKREDETLIINADKLSNKPLPSDVMSRFRGGNLLLGAMLARCGSVTMPMPGGCYIGSRPMDYHIAGLSRLGAKTELKGGNIVSYALKLISSEIYLDFPSVGATENLILAGTFAKGETVIRNVAKEPEIVDLAEFLNKSGAKIFGAGTDTIIIKGVNTLYGSEHKVIPDRIVAGTLLLAGAITNGDVLVHGIGGDYLEALLSKLSDSGVDVIHDMNGIRVRGCKHYDAVDINTMPYPGFPTDLQPQFMSYLTMANGTSVVKESIFENRFCHKEDLCKMGANIRVDGRVAIVEGVKHLSGAEVTAHDLRGGAGMILAAMASFGDSVLNNIHHIDRGYNKIEKIFNDLGANIKRVCIN